MRTFSRLRRASAAGRALIRQNSGTNNSVVDMYGYLAVQALVYSRALLSFASIFVFGFHSLENDFMSPFFGENGHTRGKTPEHIRRSR